MRAVARLHLALAVLIASTIVNGASLLCWPWCAC